MLRCLFSTVFADSFRVLNEQLGAPFSLLGLPCEGLCRANTQQLHTPILIASLRSVCRTIKRLCTTSTLAVGAVVHLPHRISRLHHFGIRRPRVQLSRVRSWKRSLQSKGTCSFASAPRQSWMPQQLNSARTWSGQRGCKSRGAAPHPSRGPRGSAPPPPPPGRSPSPYCQASWWHPAHCHRRSLVQARRTVRPSRKQEAACPPSRLVSVLEGEAKLSAMPSKQA
jgi:hypothetical protein